MHELPPRRGTFRCGLNSSRGGVTGFLSRSPPGRSAPVGARSRQQRRDVGAVHATVREPAAHPARCPWYRVSSTPLFPISVPALADLLVAVLDESRRAVGGCGRFSYRPGMAQQLAFDHPTRVAAAGAGGNELRHWRISWLAPGRHEPGDTDSLLLAKFFDRTRAATNGGVTARDQSVRERMINARRSHPPAADGYTMQLLGIFGWSSWHFLRCIPHETLVIAGDDDPLVPVANARMLAERIPNATLEIVAGAGHLLLWDDPENLGRRISAFLNPARTRPTSGPARPARTRRHASASRVALRPDSSRAV